MVSRLILVHSPLVGPGTWEQITPALAGRGYQVSVPDLTGTLAAGPPYCSRQAGVIAASAAGQPAVLIGHSGAGPLLALAAAMLGGDARGCIFADAGLPIPGQNWLETVPAELAAQVRGMTDAQGWLPPWPQWWGPGGLAELLPDPDMRSRFAAGCPRLPLAMFGEIHPQEPPGQDPPGAYLRLSEAYDEQAAAARARGWPVIELASHHLAPLTDPGPVTGSLLELLRRLPR
jgi:pimeloyl-ACP methyl ester carboxylesterase